MFYILSVPNMSCDHCKMRIENELKKIGVNEYDVSLEKKEIRLKTDEIDVVIKRLNSIGYEAFVVSKSYENS